MDINKSNDGYPIFYFSFVIPKIRFIDIQTEIKSFSRLHHDEVWEYG